MIGFCAQCATAEPMQEHHDYETGLTVYVAECHGHVDAVVVSMDARRTVDALQREGDDLILVFQDQEPSMDNLILRNNGNDLTLRNYGYYAARQFARKHPELVQSPIGSVSVRPEQRRNAIPATTPTARPLAARLPPLIPEEPEAVEAAPSVGPKRRRRHIEL